MVAPVSERPALVLVHGFMGGSAQWAIQHDYFSDRYKVVTPDLPGFGNNAHLSAPTTIADYARFVLDCLSKLGVERFHLLGHSMGGMIVQEMIAQAPVRVAKLILYGTGAVGNLPDRFEPMDVSRKRARADGAVATAERIAATWFVDGADAPEYANCSAIAKRASLQAICAGLDAMESWTGETHLAEIASRTLIVWGDCDRSYSWNQILQLWETIPDTNLAVVPACAHAVHMEKPEIFNALVADFLELA